jgi:hypothetical protein
MTSCGSHSRPSPDITHELGDLAKLTSDSRRSNSSGSSTASLALPNSQGTPSAEFPNARSAVARGASVASSRCLAELRLANRDSVSLRNLQPRVRCARSEGLGECGGIVPVDPLQEPDHSIDQIVISGLDTGRLADAPPGVYRKLVACNADEVGEHLVAALREPRVPRREPDLLGDPSVAQAFEKLPPREDDPVRKIDRIEPSVGRWTSSICGSVSCHRSSPGFQCSVM